MGSVLESGGGPRTALAEKMRERFGLEPTMPNMKDVIET
jgi:hypothetical protein